MPHVPKNLPFAPPAECVRPADVPIFRELLEGHGVDTTDLSDREVARMAENLVEVIALMHRIVARDGT